MITYANESLFYQDNVEKQITISFTGGSIINSNLRAEELELVEDLCTSNELKFGECNANKISFVVGYYENSIAGKTITVSITPSGASAFQLGVYKVLSDYPTANKRFRKIIAYDKLYDILKMDVTSWYNTLLPNTSTTKTLKQFRDSFFTYVGVTQETQTLPNDNLNLTRTINPSCLTGKDVITKICEINGAFGKITRSGTFKYIFLEQAASGLFPSETLYPANDLYPQRYGFLRQETYVYNALEYEEYICNPIDKLQMVNKRGDVQISVGSGTNAYILKDNFLIFDKNDTAVTSVANNLYAKISGRFFRPAKIDTIGNPCIEVGDGIQLFTVDGFQIDTYVLRRKLKGIQSLKDQYISDGLENRANDRNTTSEQINQVKDNVRRIEADYVKTTYLEAIYITASQISSTYVTSTYLTTNYLTANEISADYATINSLSAVDAKFNNLNADNITAGTVSASHIDIDGVVASFSGKALTSSSLTTGSVSIKYGNVYLPLQINSSTGNVYVTLP